MPRAPARHPRRTALSRPPRTVNAPEGRRVRRRRRWLVSAGHELGNHTYTHCRMVFVSPDTVAAEVEPTNAVIRQAGQRGEIPFRPPTGKKLQRASAPTGTASSRSRSCSPARRRGSGGAVPAVRRSTRRRGRVR
ncbi:polysaccharide deacetylase family protein [Nonomuraea sp. NPDC005983]|uniref:polysaccharide deacetylase family protein n=1 Tax=Nonomuraea sp. NPDC005983 TaxID=3155595 RepID=UPI0033BF4D2E